MISPRKMTDMKIRDQMLELITSKVVNCSLDKDGKVIGDPYVTYEEIASKCFDTTLDPHTLYIISALVAVTAKKLKDKNPDYPYIASLVKKEDTGKAGMNFFACAYKVKAFIKSAEFASEDSKEATDFLSAKVTECVKYFGKETA